MNEDEITIDLENEDINIEINEEENENIEIEKTEIISVTKYNELDNKPKINNVTLENNKTLDELGIINDKNYLHIQNVASNEWIIYHNMNKYPTVSVIDSAGNEVIGEVEYIDNNNLRIKFVGSFSGKATLN